MKKLLAMAVAASLVLSSAVYAADTVSVKQTGVDVVAAATNTTPAPAPAKTTKPTTPKQSPAPATEITRTLKLGSKGADVKLLQTLLNNQGFKLKVDGIFGKLTLGAVKSYQGKSGLKADGIVDSKTVAKLKPVVAVPTPAPVPVPTPAPAPAPTPAPAPDTVSAASIVKDADAFEKAIAKDGKWIICTLNDLTINKDLVLTGNFKNGKKDAKTGLDAIQRKIALYTQDDKHNVTARFTLTAPKLTILSPNASIQHGTFKGDLYVGVSGFKLVDMKVDGNVYFTTKAAQATFSIDDKSSITGKQELIAVDAVTTASLVNNAADFEKGIAKDGKWIISAINDLTTDKELVLTGNFKNGKKDAKTGLDAIQRKIALYTQDDKHVTTGRFTLTAPKLTILSPNASIQKGTFKGDLYVEVPNFQLVDAVIDGNVYFTNKDAQATFKADATSIITGKQELIAATGVDAVASASLVDNNEAFEKAIAKDGKWIIAPLKSLTFDKALVMEGDFHDKNDAAKPLKRKIGLYTQDDKHVTTGRFMLIAPKLTVMATNATIQKGIFKGDLYVTATGFNLVDAVVDGNIYFANQAAKDSFTMDATSIVTGVQEIKAN